jgi:hypothetical protein
MRSTRTSRFLLLPHHILRRLTNLDFDSDEILIPWRPTNKRHWAAATRWVTLAAAPGGNVAGNDSANKSAPSLADALWRA